MANAIHDWEIPYHPSLGFALWQCGNGKGPWMMWRFSDTFRCVYEEIRIPQVWQVISNSIPIWVYTELNAKNLLFQYPSATWRSNMDRFPLETTVRMPAERNDTRPGKQRVCELENGKKKIVDFPIKDCDFPYFLYVYQRVKGFQHCVTLWI